MFSERKGFGQQSEDYLRGVAENLDQMEWKCYLMAVDANIPFDERRLQMENSKKLQRIVREIWGVINNA